MRDKRPDPPVPADADLRHFPGMMVDVTRILRSEFIMEASKAGIGAAFLLWCAAWHEVPAGSLPANERVRARLALCDWSEWEALRDEAMHGYVLCTDDRYHHTVGSMFVLDALKRSRSASARGKLGAAARWHPDGKGKGAANGTSMAKPSPEHGKGIAEPMLGDANGPDQTRLDQTGPDERDSRARALVPHGEVQGLVGIINKAFIERGKHLVLSEHQLGFVRKLADRAAHEPDPQDWTRRYLNTAWQLRKAGKDVWRGQPWQPSAICGEAMQARVIEAMDGAQQELSAEDMAYYRDIGRRSA